MTLKEFQELIGGRHAAVMVCQVDGSKHMGKVFKSGDMLNVDLRTAFAKYKEMANLPGGGEGHRWLPSNANITNEERDMMNKHFEKEHEMESGDAPIKIKSQKK